VVSESAWQVVSDQALSLSSINNGAQLKQLLAHHIPAKLKDSARQKTNLHQINSIDSLVVLNTEIIRQGKLIRGCEYRVVVNGEHFTSAGELFLFGSLLDQLFGLQMSLNNFSRLTVTDLQTGDSSEWSTRLGATWAI
jgi:type VI secretion system protein ImpG